MEVKRRTQAERSEATRRALMAAARRLFAEQGYAAVGTEAIVQAAGVTRGAMYHQFSSKAELFTAVFEAVEVEVTERLMLSMADDVADPIEIMARGAEAWLEASVEPEFQRIVLLDGPAVLGWERWRELELQYGAGLVEGLVTAAIEAGRLEAQPPQPLAHVLIGALDEAALYVARADDPAQARTDVVAALRRVLDGLAQG